MALPVIKVKGSYYNIGFQMGTSAKSLILGALEEHQTFSDELLPFYHTPEGSLFVNSMLDRIKENFPHYNDELHGIADGANVPFIHLLLINLSNEIGTYLKEDKVTSQDGCTDLFLVSDNKGYLVHTEDCVPEVAKKGFFVDATITSEDDVTVLEQFVTYVFYPGIMCGTGFGYNKAGICSSMNIIFQNSINEKGLPMRFVCRAILGLESVDQIMSLILRNPGVTTGFNYNLLLTSPDGKPHISNLEVVGTSRGSVVHRNDVQGFQCHCNEHKYLSSVAEISSQTRVGRLSEMIQARFPGSTPDDLGDVLTLSDLLDMISDTASKDYPIFKTGALPDFWATAAIGVFDIKQRKMMVYTDRPCASNPQHQFDMYS